MLAAGRGSGLAFELRRILANPRWFDAWLWIQEENRIFSVVTVWFRVRRRRQHWFLLAPKAKHTAHAVPFFDDPALAPYELQHGCNKQTSRFVFVLSRNTVEENFLIVKNTITLTLTLNIELHASVVSLLESRE